MYIVKTQTKNVLNTSAFAGVEAKMPNELHGDCTKNSSGTRSLEMNVILDMSCDNARTS